jgi:hypothetical protein
MCRPRRNAPVPSPSRLATLLPRDLEVSCIRLLGQQAIPEYCWERNLQVR